MIQAMTAPGVGLSVPSSRQDIVSALLNDYGSSFGQSDDSPYATSPVFKELPPPPPPTNSEKPLPPGLTTTFQLRVNEQISPDGRKNSIGSPTRITSKFITRSSKPRSLNLTVSNGSTAIVPPSPAPQVPAKESPGTVIPQPLDERPLPPPPPEKSERRKPLQQPEAPAGPVAPAAPAAMGHNSSKLDRRDSKEPQESTAGLQKQRQNEAPVPTQATKRKPLPASIVPKKFPSLADLKNGPRGSRSAIAKSAKSDADSDKTVTRTSSQDSSRTLTVDSNDRSPLEQASSRNALAGDRPHLSKSNLPTQCPPSSDELPQEKKEPVQPPPRKVYAGLPSNPRAKNQDQSKTHAKGKSSTGFDVMKNFTATLNIAPPNPNTTAPGPSPSPNKMNIAQPQQEPIEPPSLATAIQSALREDKPIVSNPPMSEKTEEGQRPFSYEPVPPPPRKQESAMMASLTSPFDAPHAEPAPQMQAAAPTQFPPRTSSNADTQQTQFPPRTSSNADSQQTQFPPRTTSRPAGEPETVEASHATKGEQALEDESTFIPLTQAPISTPARPITARQLHCYTNHNTFTTYQSRFQTVACMACGQTERGARCTCTWCLLQICAACRDDLRRTPGRKLQVLLERKSGAMGKESGGMPSVVVTGTERI